VSGAVWRDAGRQRDCGLVPKKAIEMAANLKLAPPFTGRSDDKLARMR